MDANVAYTARSRHEGHSELWTVAFGGPARGRLGWAAEVFGYIRESRAVLAGPTFALRKYLALDAGVIAPLHGSQPRAIYAGLVYNVGRIR
jgi:hypothetical protein